MNSLGLPPDTSVDASVSDDSIGRATSPEEIINALAKRGCLDLTSSIDPATCKEDPYAFGGFCDVFKGALYDGTDIAIKRLRVCDGPEAEGDGERRKVLKRAARELYHWSKLWHCNVLPLMGLAVFRGRISMISEWMNHGNLSGFVRLNPGANRSKLCVDVCTGLCYMHANDMVHGDLKAANIMVSSNGTAMIADFGNARLKDLTLQFSNTKKLGLSVRWAAPELLLEDDCQQMSKEADVYAYGMTALETMTGKVPYGEIGDNRVIYLVASGIAPPRPETGVNDGLWCILNSCWTREPSKRPVIASVERWLRSPEIFAIQATMSLPTALPPIGFAHGSQVTPLPGGHHVSSSMHSLDLPHGNFNTFPALGNAAEPEMGIGMGMSMSTGNSLGAFGLGGDSFAIGRRSLEIYAPKAAIFPSPPVGLARSSSTGGGSSNGHNNVHNPYSPFNFSQPQPFLTTSSSSAPSRPEFAVPVLPQRIRAPVQSSPLGPGTQSPVHSAPRPSSVSVPASRRGKDIHRSTSQHRTRQQISSHIQLINKGYADDPAMMRIPNGQLDLPASSSTSRPAAGRPVAPLPLSRLSSNSTSPLAIVKSEGAGSLASPQPMPSLDPIERLLGSQPFMSVIHFGAPSSITSDTYLLGTSPLSASHTDSKEPLQIAELIPRSDVPPEPVVPRAMTEPLAADRLESPAYPKAWRGERLAYITAITIWAERTLKDAGVGSRPTTTHVFAQMHSASCPLEPLPADMEGIVRDIQPGTCMHAEIGIALPPAGVNVGKIRATLVIEAMKEFDGYCLTDAFCGQEGRFMSTHTTVFPTGREAREKYSWTLEVPYATEVWRKILKENPQGAHGMRLVQKYVRSLAGGNRDGDLNVPLLVVHDVKIVPPGEVGYSKIKHVDLTGEQAKHDAREVVGRAIDDDSEESESDEDGDTRMDEDDGEAENRRERPNASAQSDVEQLQMRANQLADNQGLQAVAPLEQVVHTSQQPPPVEGGVPRGMEAEIPFEFWVNGSLGHAPDDSGGRMAWLTRDALAAGTLAPSEFEGREPGLGAPARIERNDEYFPML